MARYRIKHKYPCYTNDSYIPRDGYFVQKLQKGLSTRKWVDIKGYGDRKNAEELLKILKG